MQQQEANMEDKPSLTVDVEVVEKNTFEKVKRKVCTWGED